MLQLQMRRALAPVLAGTMALSALSPALAQGYGSRSIPQNTVVRVKLDDELSSRESRVGDRFMARLADSDYSGFPRGTRFEGTVTQVQRATKDRPGVLDMKIHRALMPDGRMVASTAFLASLNEDDVVRVGRGRLESRSRSRGNKIDWKWAGYGAAGGAVLGEIFGGSFIKGALLGGLGGAVYGYLNRDKGRRGDFRDVELARGQEFGIRMHERVVFADNSEYSYASYDDRDYDRNRDDYRDRDDDRNRDYDRDRDRYEDERRRDERERYEDQREYERSRDRDRERYEERIPERGTAR